MWSKVLLLTLVGLAASEHGWKNGNQYRYELRARTMTGIHQVADQYTGIVFRGNLNILPKGDDLLNIRVQNLEQAEVHTNLSGGWSTYLPDHDLKYQQLPISKKPFELKLKNGIVDEMYVNKNLPTWEVNILKAIASQLQVDTQAQNIKRSKMNQVPAGGLPMGVFKTVEDTVTGECETVYDISPLPQFVLQSKPELAPLPYLKGDGQFIDIVKTKNYSDCEQRMAYHFGLTGLTDWEPASNQMGSFLSRSSVSRIVISGQLKSFTIQSSVTTNKVILAPHLYNNQKGIVASRMNLTLEAVTSSSGSPQEVSNPRTIKNLVYEYNAASQEENAQNHHMARQGQGEDSSSSSSESSSQTGENSSSSSSSSSSSEENFHGHQDGNIMSRSRRSANQNRRNMSGSSSSSSSSSSSGSSDSSSSSSTSSSEEEFWQPRPKLSEAPHSPFMPYSIGFAGNSIQASKKIDGVYAVPKLALEIGEETQYGNGITGENTLTKFSIMVGVIHTMNAQQLERVTQKLYTRYSKGSQGGSEAVKYQAWAAYRDAVAQAGTGPALLSIKQWIKEGKIGGEEAAEIVGVLVGSARYPTTEYMDAFFELVKSEEVRKQRHLNTTALIAFTDLVRKAQVSEKIAHNRYPVHSFGRLAPKNDKVVAEKYIPYLEEQLQKGVQQGDSIWIQTYTRALGNTAHPKILGVFEPYLEGKQQTSDFQRLAIVASFDRMTKIYPSLIRSVLFKIYQNSGETPEVRTAAVIQLMKTNPPAQILQRMAQHTNYDHSRQVNAAVKSAIENAAGLEGPENYQLSQNAKSAVNLLTREEFGFQESHNFLRDYVVKGEELMYKTQLSYIQGKDSMVPSTAFFNVWRGLGGYQRPPMQLGWTTSGVGSLMELLSDQFESEGETGYMKQQRQGHLTEGEGQWSLEKIAKLLNVQPEEAEQVEGNILVHLFGAQRYFAFDNHTIERLPQYVRDLYQQLRGGRRFEQSKIYNQYSVQIGFPTETGLPFFYSLSTPTRAYLGGEFTAQTNPEMGGEHDKIKLPKSVNLKGDLQIIYTAKTEGVFGFSTPHDHKAYVAGLGKNLHVAVPIRASVEIDRNKNNVEATVEPLQTEGEQKLFEYSTVAYTAKHDILELRPIVEGDDTEQIHVRPVQRVETTVGQSGSGFAFDIKAESEQKFIDWATTYKALERHDGLSALLFADYQQTITNKNFTITYNPEKSTSKFTKFSFTYNERQQGEHNERAEGGENLAIPSSSSPQDQQRQNEFLQRSGAGIKGAYSQVVDLAVQFDGQPKAEYVATAAYGRSFVDQKSRYLFFYGMKPAKSQGMISPYQLAVQVDTKTPHVPVTDFQKALRADPMSYITAKVNFGENAGSKGGQVNLQGKLKQSGARREFVQEHPLSALCQQQMQEGNYILPACRNATASANFLDQYRLTFNYEGVPNGFKQFIYKAYSIGRYFGAEYVDESIGTGQGKEGEVEIDIDFEQDLRSVNISFDGPGFSTKFNNVEVYDWISPLVVGHPEYNAYQRLGQELFRSQQYPTCVVDKNQATTFNNRSYPFNIGKCWHAMVHPHRQLQYGQENNDHYGDQDFGILVRETSSNQKELLILLGKEVIRVQPSGSSEVSGKVTVGGQNADFSKDKLAQFKNKNGDIFLQVYALPSGEVRILAPETGFEVIYDGTRVKLLASNYFRNGVHGLCGKFNGEYITDFESPKNCILKNPLEFAASYALVDESCQGPAKELNQKAQSAPCFWESVMLGNVVSEEEAGRGEASRKKHSPSNKLKGMGGMQNEEMCSKQRVKIIEQQGKTCFSLRPMTTCSSKCKSTNRIEKHIDFHCVPNSAATKHWTSMINAGSNPDFSQKPSNAVLKLHVPERCIPK